ncbi:hypothetical protein M422DRAFT_50871 [Sphaerobolus stellatus SS14]|uniref:Uncharacterized protein n=1 Tax=Sphaerobolus stellatus (strain SS14) TaxID=990650 RepID=A0A0C9V4V9_SPHS4|nr:hypothetical protein M422DRAFT_50871 [Sphaerobolus stellatus SS14]
MSVSSLSTRPSSPSGSDISTGSNISTSSGGSTCKSSSTEIPRHNKYSSPRLASLIYSRDELLSLGTSPLAHSGAPAALALFPEIIRRTPRGPLEALQALEYSHQESSTPHTFYPRPRRNRRNNDIKNKKHEEAHNQTPQPKPAPVQDIAASLPVLKVGVYVPPALRHMASEQQQQRERSLPNRSLRQAPRSRRRNLSITVAPNGETRQPLIAAL